MSARPGTLCRILWCHRPA